MIEISERERAPLSSKVHNALAALSIFGSALILFWLLRHAEYGFDFTDESSYLIWISNPFIYPASLTQFGFIYHPLYVALQGDIAALRQANILITFGLSWALSYCTLNSVNTPRKPPMFICLAISFGLALCVLTSFGTWLATPSYNSLALQALLITALGLMCAEKKMSYKSIAGWLLIGIGGWLAFMAKPSTAAALAVVTMGYICFSKIISLKALALTIAASGSLLISSSLVIDGSVEQFVARLQLGLVFSSHLEAGYSMSELLRIDKLRMDRATKIAFFSILCTLTLSFLTIYPNNKKRYVIGTIISCSFLVATLAIITDWNIHELSDRRIQTLVALALPCAVILHIVLSTKPKSGLLRSIPHLPIALLFLVMPHVYAFGTNGNYWITGSSAAIFWLLAAVIISIAIIRTQAYWILPLQLVFATQVVTAAILQAGFEHPYRQPQPLRMNTSVLSVGPQNSILILSDAHAEFIKTAVKASLEAGLTSNTPVIDLSGQSPGILFALNATSIGQAWMIGGYPGSQKLAEAALLEVSCQKISAAWLLYEPKGPRSISPTLMNRFGIAFPDRYEKVGSWQTAEGVGGYQAQRTQELYRPVNTKENLAACKATASKEGQ